jgi:hypothetical protein
MENKTETLPISSEEKLEERIESSSSEMAPEKKRRRKKSVARDIMAIALVVLAMIGGYAYFSWQDMSKKSATTVKEKVTEFVKTNMVRPGTEVKLSDFVRENGLYRATFSVDGQEFVTYATVDGQTFFPQAVNMDEQAKAAANTSPPVVEAEVKKDVPVVDLFVMSYCPYGLQMQKGILPVIEALGSSIDFAMRWVGYTMHGKKEFNENIRQYCINKEEPTKYAPYLSCFTASEKGDAPGCGKAAKVNEAKIAACVAATDKEFQLTEKYDEQNEGSSPFGIDKALNEKYGVSGVAHSGGEWDDAFGESRSRERIEGNLLGIHHTSGSVFDQNSPPPRPLPVFGTGTDASSGKCRFVQLVLMSTFESLPKKISPCDAGRFFCFFNRPFYFLERAAMSEGGGEGEFVGVFDVAAG